jgi:hypothetical protein
MSDNPLNDGEGLDLDHLQRMNLQRQAAATRQLLEEQERQRKGVCPCPHCGGGIPKVGVSACMHCGRDLHWLGRCCGKSMAHAQQLARAAAEQAALQQKLLQKEKSRKEKAEQWANSPAGKREFRKNTAGCVIMLVGVWCLAVGFLSFASGELKIDGARINGWLFTLMECGFALAVWVGWSFFTSTKNPFLK